MSAGAPLAAPPPSPSALGAWVLAARPRTLLASVAPVVVGAALAATAVELRWAAVVGCLLGATLIQIGTNFANDAFDAMKGADGPDRIGPRRAVASGLVTPRAMLAATALTLVAALAIGLWLAQLGGWPILALGVVSLACAVAYTGGPFPLAYRGLGDLFVLLFFGLFAVLGTAWIQVAAAGRPALPAAWWLVAGAVGLQATAIIAINNIRDIAGDARVGKRTLAVRLGARAARAYHAVLHVGAGACLAAAALIWARPWLMLPAALALAGGGAIAAAVWRRDGRELNPLLGRAALLEAVTAAAIAVALIL